MIMDRWTGGRYAVYAHRCVCARYMLGMGECCPCVHFVDNILDIAQLRKIARGQMRTG